MDICPQTSSVSKCKVSEKIFNLLLMRIDYMVTLLSVKGLHSSVNIMGSIDKYMLATEVDVEFSMMNGFMYKYMHRQQAIIV